MAMASEAIRAVYEEGYLRLLDPVDLAEGQEIELRILTAQEHVRDALQGLLVAMPAPADDEFDEVALLHAIGSDLQDQEPLSETILQERSEGL
jgi:predicted DNA-binding antitoxin AbrB/MazE fold protein